jgi:putative transposase
MDEEHLMAAFRYVALNPVRARLAKRAQDWQWSSAKGHLSGKSDRHVRVEPALDRIADFAAFLEEPFEETAAYAPLRKAESVGRPVGSPEWIEAMEAKTGLKLKPAKRGPAPRTKV